MKKTTLLATMKEQKSGIITSSSNGVFDAIAFSYNRSHDSMN